MSTHAGLEIATDMVANATNIFSLATKSSGLVAKVATRGAYHLAQNFENSGRKVNGKVIFRKFQPKIEDYVLR